MVRQMALLHQKLVDKNENLIDLFKKLHIHAINSHTLDMTKHFVIETLN